MKNTNGWFWDKVQFTATKYHEAIFGTFLGDKKFWMNEGDFVTLRMSKDDFWKIGDKAISLQLLITMNNQHKFKWNWK